VVLQIVLVVTLEAVHRVLASYNDSASWTFKTCNAEKRIRYAFRGLQAGVLDLGSCNRVGL
jgi:hypothetical protein